MVDDSPPYAAYGKPEPGVSPDGYRFLFRDAAFDTPAADRALRQIVAAIEWKPGADSHPPVFGAMRVGGVGTLMARFSDVGRDAHGRPHTLRVDCVLCPDFCLERLSEAGWEAPCFSEAPPEPPPLPEKVVCLWGNARTFTKSPEAVLFRR